MRKNYEKLYCWLCDNEIKGHFHLSFCVTNTIFLAHEDCMSSDDHVFSYELDYDFLKKNAFFYELQDPRRKQVIK